MRAVEVRKPCEIDELEITELPDPEPAAGELLVRVFATTVSERDIAQRRGEIIIAAGESAVLGREWAGEIAKVGEGVDGFSRGDRVFGICSRGACADYLAIDAKLAMIIPDTLSFDAAATIPESFFTAHELLVHRAQVSEGDQVAIVEDRFGVSAAAAQMVRELGAFSSTEGDSIFAEVDPRASAERLTREFAERWLPYFEDGRLTAFVDSVELFEDVRYAFERAESDECRGKVVLRL